MNKEQDLINNVNKTIILETEKRVEQYIAQMHGMETATLLRLAGKAIGNLEAQLSEARKEIELLKQK